MPKSAFDWLAVASLWVAAIVLAVKTGELTLMDGAPDWLAANWWGYVPAVLLTFYVIAAFYRLLRPVGVEAAPTPYLSENAGAVTRGMNEDQRTIQALAFAKHAAKLGVGHRSVAAAEKELPTMKAALLLSHNVFQTPLPAEVGRAAVDLENGRRLIEAMLPFLQHGLIKEAISEGERLLGELNCGPSAPAK